MVKEKDPYGHWKSAWLITLNTNSSNPNLIGPLLYLWEYIISDLKRFTYGIKGTSITGVREANSVEKGDKFHRYHIHSKVEISSRGLVSLDYSRIKKFIDSNMKQIPTFVGIHFNAKLIPKYNQAELIKAYLEKAPLKKERNYNLPQGFKIKY